MTIKVVKKFSRLDASVQWYGRDSDDYWTQPAAFDEISQHVDVSNPCEWISTERPDDLTIIITHAWPDLDTYNAVVGDWDASSNSAWKAYSNVRGTYNVLNNITVIRYIYDEDNNLTTTQKRVNKVYWEDYSE
jgi:hypothetical protein